MAIQAHAAFAFVQPPPHDVRGLSLVKLNLRFVTGYVCNLYLSCTSAGAPRRLFPQLLLAYAIAQQLHPVTLHRLLFRSSVSLARMQAAPSVDHRKSSVAICCLSSAPGFVLGMQAHDGLLSCHVPGLPRREVCVSEFDPKFPRPEPSSASQPSFRRRRAVFALNRCWRHWPGGATSAPSPSFPGSTA
jgi:hypothetical protein